MPSQHRRDDTQSTTARGGKTAKARRTFGRHAPRKKKATAGATPVSATPLRIHVAGPHLEPAEKHKVREVLGRRLWRFAGDITRATVRFEDINGPRGGVDTVCRIKLSIVGLSHVIVEARDLEALAAFRRAATSARAAVTRAMERRGRTAPRVELPPIQHPRKAPPQRRPPGGSLIGRRVGRSRENLERTAEKPARADSWVDTSLPGVSATDRKAGGGSTAARNVRLHARRASATLEDSARERPSRKSTRKSANRQKAGAKLGRAKKRAHHSPSARARRSG